MENLYELLDVDPSADEKDIKRAYVKMIRKYPPEKEPEMFQKIRKAYEQLSDSLSRKQYDALESYGEVIEQLSKQGEEALDSEDYQIAIRCYKKILLIEPTFAFAKNQLGIAFLRNDQIQEAITQFEEVIEINPDNVVYYCNLGYAYRLNKQYDKAEKILKKACALDNIESDAVMELVEVYRDQKKSATAIELLRKCIAADKPDTDEKRVFNYYIKVIEIYILDKDKLQTHKALEELVKVVRERKESSDYVVWKLGKLAFKLYEVEAYSVAIKVAETALKIAPEDEDLKELIKRAKLLDTLTTAHAKMREDERIVGPLTGPSYYYLYKSDYEDEAKYNEDRQINFNAIQSYIDHEPEALTKGIDILKVEYAVLYKEQKDLYDDIYNQARKSIETHKQFDKLINHEYNVAHPFKRLIALWLDNDVDDNKRQRVFDEIMDEINQLQYNQVQSSVNTLRHTYPNLYQLNDETLDEFKAIADQIQKENVQRQNHSTSVSSSSSSSTSSSSTYQSSNRSSSNTTSSSNDGGGCLVVLICAIIGNFIVPGIGFFVGGYIGLKIVG